jgi:tetratricopeptide (TPR) repeat protein
MPWFKNKKEDTADELLNKIAISKSSWTTDEAKEQEKNVEKLVKFGNKIIPLVENKIKYIVYSGDYHAYSSAQKLCEAIGKIGDQDAFDMLLYFLTYETSYWEYETVRLGAVNGLSLLGDARAVPYLKELQQKGNTTPYVNKAVSDALEKLGAALPIDPLSIIAKVDMHPFSDDASDLLNSIDEGAFNTLSSSKKYYLYYLKGRIYDHKGDRTKAIECFKKSLTYEDSPQHLAHNKLRGLGAE